MNGKRLALTLVFSFVSAVPSLAQLELDDIRAVRSFRAIEISLADERIAYVLDEPGPDGGRRSDLWVAGSRGGATWRRTEYGDVGGVVRWSPEADRIAFLRSGDPSSVWLIRPESGAPGLVETELGRIRDLEWSPDGRTLALVAGEGGRSSAEGIYLLEVDRDRGRWLLPPERHGLSIAWAPDGRHLAFSAQDESGFYGRLESDLHLVSVEDGRVRPLVERPGVDREPLFDPDGDRIAFVSGFGVTGMLAGLGVSVIDVETGSVRDLAPTEKGSFFTGPALVGWSPDGDGVLYEVTDGVRRPLESVSITDAKIRRVSRDSTFYWSSYRAASGTITFLGERGDRPPELHMSPLESFRPVRLTSVNDFFHALDDIRFEVVEWTNSEGGRIEGMLLRPEATSEPLPLLTILHGGPAVAVSQGFWALEFFNPYRDDMFASRGYAVFLPNPRGSAGYGTGFMGAVRGDWGTAPADDVTSGIDRLVERGIADPDRLGLMGWSYGGYLTAWILTRTDRFAAASVGAGPVNLVSHFAQGARQMLDYFEVPPWEDPDRYLRSSPIFQADRIRTPTLVQQGDEDTAVSPSQAEELHTALGVVGTPVELEVYEGEGHVVRSPETQERAWRTTWEWFRSRLQP